jgi:hypothetical protein
MSVKGIGLELDQVIQNARASTSAAEAGKGERGDIATHLASLLLATRDLPTATIGNALKQQAVTLHTASLSILDAYHGLQRADIRRDVTDIASINFSEARGTRDSETILNASMTALAAGRTMDEIGTHIGIIGGLVEKVMGMLPALESYVDNGVQGINHGIQVIEAYAIDAGVPLSEPRT